MAITCALCGETPTGFDTRIGAPTCRECASKDLPDALDQEVATTGETHAGPPAVEQDERGDWTAFEMAADRLDAGGENDAN